MITQKKLKSHFKYDPKTGNLIRIKAMGNGGRWRVGTVLGTIDKDGYICANFDGGFYKVHHLVWLFHHGYMPKMLDHINRIPGDNRIENLREANKRINSINTGIQKNNTSGVRGVSWSKQNKKWEVYIHHYGKKKNLGLYEDLEEAKKIRRQAEIESGDFIKYG